MPPKRACDLTVEERAGIIRHSDFGSTLSEDLLARLASASAAFDYRRRRFIYRSGDAADALYVIERGRVKLCRLE
jgi:CRP-like cAMP-binding protein